MDRLTCRRGMILLHTLVMSVILSMISVMVMQWVLGRYLIAERTYRSSMTGAHALGYSSNLFSNYNFNTAGIPTSGSVSNATTDNKVVTYSVSGTKFTFSSDEDQ